MQFWSSVSHQKYRNLDFKILGFPSEVWPTNFFFLFPETRNRGFETFVGLQRSKIALLATKIQDFRQLRYLCFWHVSHRNLRCFICKKMPWEKTIFLSLGESIFCVLIVYQHLHILCFPLVSSELHLELGKIAIIPPKIWGSFSEMWHFLLCWVIIFKWWLWATGGSFWETVKGFCE